jgi:hypothetical protein
MLAALQVLWRLLKLWLGLNKETKMDAARILAIAIPFAKDVIVWYMEMTGRTEITLADLKAKTPDELLAEVGVVLP